MITDKAREKAKEAAQRNAEYEEEAAFVRASRICPLCAEEVEVEFLYSIFFKCKPCKKTWSYRAM